jgi:hypothetical protein
MQELLPVGYYHLVFTIPHELNQLCLQNKKRIPSTNPVLQANLIGPTFAPCEKIKGTAKNRCMP